MKRLEIRKIVQEKANKLYKSIPDGSFKWLVGDIMASNEEYILNYQGADETYKTLAILKQGFSDSQLKWIKKVLKKIREESK